MVFVVRRREDLLRENHSILRTKPVAELQATKEFLTFAGIVRQMDAGEHLAAERISAACRCRRSNERRW